ncbi:MAG: dual specificity protein phosphatase family protein [Tenuifilaceae bacterium]|jgi:predicted protein tyrosine phosphatase|nr:dual specificity protein phosphatase family protein [Tenuifilaceae bacterium]
MYKFVDFVSKRVAEDIEPKSDWIIISINEPLSITNLKEGWLDILPLTFEDLDIRLNDYLIFNNDDAKQIIDFVEKYENQASTIIVHCHAGISRSAAVAKFIAEKYDLKFNHNYFLYNKLVYKILNEVEREETKSIINKLL